MTTDPNYVIEIAYSNGHVAYLTSMNTSKWSTDKKIKYRITAVVPAGDGIPVNAVHVNYGRALELAGILTKCGRIVKIVEVVKEVTV